MAKTIDADKVIRLYNEKNPNKKQLDRKGLAGILKRNKQLFSDWKKKGPKLVDDLVKMAEIADCSIEELLIDVNE